MGTRISTTSRTCTPIEIICAVLYSRRLAQRGFTGTGLLVNFNGGNFGGEIRSCRLRQKTRYVGSRSTTMPEAAAPPLTFGAGLKNAFRLSEKLLSTPSVRKTCCRAFRGTRIDRSVRKSLRLVQKP